MLTIICGEDIAASRKYFNDLKLQYKAKNYLLQEIAPDQIQDLDKGLGQSSSLFAEKIVFVTQHLDRYYKKLTFRKRGEDPLTLQLKKISASADIEVLDWENKSAWEIKIKKIVPVKEFKMDDNIFKLLDNLTPGSKTGFLKILNSLTDFADEQFIFIMVSRHLRSLILALSNSFPGVIPWQKFKLMSQAKKWEEKNLLKFYEGLHRIDMNLKTGANPQPVKNCLDILACYYL